MCVEFSELCNSDRELYREYLATRRHVNFSTGVVIFDSVGSSVVGRGSTSGVGCVLTALPVHLRCGSGMGSGGQPGVGPLDESGEGRRVCGGAEEVAVGGDKSDDCGDRNGGISVGTDGWFVHFGQDRNDGEAGCCRGADGFLQTARGQVCNGVGSGNLGEVDGVGVRVDNASGVVDTTRGVGKNGLSGGRWGPDGRGRQSRLDEWFAPVVGGGVGQVEAGCDGGFDGVSARQVSGVPVLDGPVRGKHYVKNKEKKERKRRLRAENIPWRSERVREKKNMADHGVNDQGRGFSELAADVRRDLKASYADRLKAENELKAFTARQRLELEKAKDMFQLKKRQETFLMSQTEMNKVRVEKAFASLARSDNVPGVVGSAETIASGKSSDGSPVFSGVGSGTISPNSSVSLAEIHALQKSELEKTHKVEKLEARLDKLRLLKPDVYKELGFLHALPPTVGTGVTVDENGSPVGDFGDGFDGYLGKDGRFHFGENYDNY